MVYLGCVLSEDGTSGSELSRRLGSARDKFANCSGSGVMILFRAKQNWMRTALAYACVVCKLACSSGFFVAIGQPEIQTLNTFHVRCLRRILKIAPSFYSRSSKQTMLDQAHSRRIRRVLRERQLKISGTLFRRSDEDVMSSTCSHPPRQQ